MFERFTKATRTVVLGAVREAERQKAPAITDEHLLLALTDVHDTVGAGLLASYGVSRDDVAVACLEIRRRGGLSTSEADALRELGIDVTEVVDRIEQSHGTGAFASTVRGRCRRLGTPFGDEGKAVLERALREAQDLGDRRIGDEHLLLALTVRGGLASEVLAAHGVTYQGIRSTLAQAS
ncbi:ClpA/ClpB-like protein [Herbihabitans rhizosphaerae]|uniref:ClpA/ClpB-like protein n=2 Tax=Herbihabitans rhizosphaerae TaxID=1872711 RepID=A0A4Q7L5Q0_9PSEU|nr:ClpA/ClpB-like protein [Herbihabitans rhizosphaerae]